MFKPILNKVGEKLSALFTRHVHYANTDEGYKALLEQLRNDSGLYSKGNYPKNMKLPDFKTAKFILEEIYDDLPFDKFDHMIAHVTFDECDQDEALEFLKYCRSIPLAEHLSSFILTSILHGASQERNKELVQTILSFPQAGNIDLSDLESSSIYAMAEGDPEIKRIEPREVNYDFGDGAPEILALFKAHIQKYHGSQVLKPKTPQ